MHYLLYLLGAAAMLGLVMRHQRRQAHENLHEEARLNRARILNQQGDLE